MKIFLMLLSFIVGNLKSYIKPPSQQLTEQIILNIRTIALNIVLIVMAIALFCPFFYLFVTHLAAQADAGTVNVTATAVIAGIMSLVSLGTLIYCFKKSTWVNSAGLKNQQQQQRPSNPIESAIAMLIMDFVKQRQDGRRDDQN